MMAPKAVPLAFNAQQVIHSAYCESLDMSLAEKGSASNAVKKSTVFFRKILACAFGIDVEAEAGGGQ